MITLTTVKWAMVAIVTLAWLFFITSLFMAGSSFSQLPEEEQDYVEGRYIIWLERLVGATFVEVVMFIAMTILGV